MSLVDPECGALVRAFLGRAPRRPPQSARASRDPMFRRTGSSFDLKNIREYAATDDPRRIDWRLEGRTGRLYVKEFFDEEREGVVLLLDRSASLEAFGREEAERVGGSIAWMLSALGLPCFMLSFSERPLSWLDLPRGGAATSPIAGFIAASPWGEGRSTDLMGAARAARRLSKYRRLAIVSDFFDPGFSPLALPFSRSLLVRLYRPFEELGPGKAEVEVLDPESGRRLRLPWDAAAEERYRERERNLDASLGEAARRGAFYGLCRLGEARKRLYWDFLEALYA